MCLLSLISPALAKEGSRATPDEFGARRFGDYELLGQIAQGGMGVVYRARQVSLNRVVALKMILAGRLATEAEVQRFRNEAEAAARLDHPHIVPVYEVGEQEGHHYFAMRFMEGASLARKIPDKKWRTDDGIKAAARLIAAVARAVQYAHARGVLHRDLKPSNILLDENGEPYVSDFGLAKIVAKDSEITGSAAILGSPSYMAPEQAAGKSRHVTTAADVYSLGAILYELLAGRPVFQAETPIETMRLAVETEAASPRRFNPQVDRDLETVCLKCLNKEAAARYTSAEALALELDRWLAGEPILARPAGPGKRFVRWCRRKPAWAATLGATGLLLLAVLIGSPIAALRIRVAQQDALAKLRESYLAQAQANRFSGRPGRRHWSLEAITKAVAMSPSPAFREALRNEAIACLALTDLRPAREWEMTAGRWEGRLCFDASTRLYALALDRTNITVRRVEDDSEAAYLAGAQSVVNWIHFFSPDSRFLAAYHRDGNYVWDISRGAIAMKFPTNNSLCFSPDSRLVAISRPDGSLSLHSLETANEVRRLKPGKHFANPKFHPNGTQLAGISSDKPGVDILEMTNSRIRFSLPAPGQVRHVAFSSDGKWLAAGTAQGLILVWNTETGERRWEMEAYETQVNNLGFNG